MWKEGKKGVGSLFGWPFASGCNSQQIQAASTKPILLAILSRGESYGYAIIEQVRLRSGGELEWSEGMLYPVLHRLENYLQSSFIFRIGNYLPVPPQAKMKELGETVVELAKAPMNFEPSDRCIHQ